MASHLRARHRLRPRQALIGRLPLQARQPLALHLLISITAASRVYLQV